MIRPFPSAKKKIPAASWPTIHRNRPQKQLSSADFWPISRSMKTHPPSWNPTAAIRPKLKPRRQQLTALTGGVRNGQRRTTCPVREASSSSRATIEAGNRCGLAATQERGCDGLPCRPNGGSRFLPPERVQRRGGRRQPAAQHNNSGFEVCLRASLTSINNSGEGLKFMEMQIIERRHLTIYSRTPRLKSFCPFKSR